MTNATIGRRNAISNQRRMRRQRENGGLDNSVVFKKLASVAFDEHAILECHHIAESPSRTWRRSQWNCNGRIQFPERRFYTEICFLRPHQDEHHLAKRHPFFN